MTTLFERKAPSIMALLMQDFDLTVVESAAIVGNLGHESGGFRFLQEKKPMIPGSRGGWGWAQWTGPRRRAFEAYVARNDLDPASDRANYNWLFLELKNEEKRAIDAVKEPGSLENKVRRFEATFERAGIKHYDSRYVYARKALAAYDAAPKPVPPLFPDAPLPETDPDDVSYLPPLVETLPPPPDVEPIPENVRPSPEPWWSPWGPWGIWPHAIALGAIVVLVSIVLKG